MWLRAAKIQLLIAQEKGLWSDGLRGPVLGTCEPHNNLISLFTVVARKLSVKSFPVFCAQDNGESSLISGRIPQLHLFLPLLFLHLLNFTLVCVLEPF